MSVLQLPSARAEGWRWSDLSALPGLASAERDVAFPCASRELHWLTGDRTDGPRLLFVDGVLDAASSRPGPVEIAPLALEAGDHPLAGHATGTGWSLRLGRDHAPDGIVQVVHVSTGGADHLPAGIDLDTDAQASVVETFVGTGWANRLTQVRLAKGARLMLTRRLLGEGGFNSLTDRAEVGEGASLVAAVLAAGGTDTRLDGDVRLIGEAAFAEVGGALLARAKQRHDANLVLHHARPNGSSRQLWRSVADDRATCSVAARVEVARHAQKTDGEQSLKGLLLSRTATINAKPELEIYADDVKCVHVATVGELDREALFYMASRGIPRADAQALLTRAFVADALERIGEEAVREACYADVDAWFSAFPLPSGEGGARREAVGG